MECSGERLGRRIGLSVLFGRYGWSLPRCP